MSTAVERAAEVLVQHQRYDSGSCLCGWGVDTGDLGRSHAEHQAQALADAGLLADGETKTLYGNKYTHHAEVDPIPAPNNEYAEWVSERHGYPLFKRTVIYGPWEEVTGDGDV